jgi:hypothetical protein
VINNRSAHGNSHLAPSAFHNIMSRWKLLKSILTHGRDPNHESSIHRGGDLQLQSCLIRRKVIWEGYYIRWNCAVENGVEAFISRCKEYLQAVDCAECFVCLNQLFDIQSCSLYKDLKAAFMAANLKVEVLPSCGRSGAVLRVCDEFYAPFLSSAQFYSYQISWLGNSEALYIREPIAKRKIAAEDILSNQRYGVDNTGNICIWPSESALLTVILEDETLRNMITGKHILEIGGGMSALAGLGLAACLKPASVLLTDGHPKCVRNQVKYNIQSAYCRLSNRILH